MPTGWDSILTVISFDDCFDDRLKMLLEDELLTFMGGFLNN